MNILKYFINLIITSCQMLHALCNENNCESQLINLLPEGLLYEVKN